MMRLIFIGIMNMWCTGLPSRLLAGFWLLVTVSVHMDNT